MKFISKNAGSILYDLKDNHYDTFCDLLVDIGNKINSKNIQILIKLNFFSEFGTISKLLKIYELYTNLYGKIQISKDKYPKLNNIFSKFAIKETEKRFTFNNTLPILKGIEKHLKNKENDVVQLILDYFEYTGACDIKNNSGEIEFEYQELPPYDGKVKITAGQKGCRIHRKAENESIMES